LKQGATLVTNAADVIEALTPILGRPEPPTPVREPPPEETPAEPASADDRLRARIVELLSPTPVAIDDLVREARAQPSAVQIVLLELELAGRLERHGSGLVSLI
jgi:DNA processing protein